MSETNAIAAKQRDVIGKASKRLASEGLIPAVLYGGGREPLSLAVDRHDFEMLLAHAGGGSTLVEVKVEGESEPINAVIKEVQTSPVKGAVMHIDFLAIRMDQLLQASVPFNLIGDAPGVIEGGVLMHTMREVLVEALPKDLPDSLEVDVSLLNIGDAVHVSDLSAPEGVEIVDDPAGIVCSVIVPTAEVEEEELEEELEGEEPELIGEEAEGEEGAEEESAEE